MKSFFFILVGLLVLSVLLVALRKEGLQGYIKTIRTYLKLKIQSIKSRLKK